MNHSEAWERLPDLLQERPEAELRAHLRSCHLCQQQLFRLSRVDALLRSHRWSQARGHRARGRLLTAASLAAAIVAATVAVLVPLRHSPPTRFVLRAARGEIVGGARLGRADADNRLVSLDARRLPHRAGDTYLLFASTDVSQRRLVGRFMVDRTGSCHVLFSLPANEQVKRLWVAPVASPYETTAST